MVQILHAFSLKLFIPYFFLIIKRFNKKEHYKISILSQINASITYSGFFNYWAPEFNGWTWLKSNPILQHIFKTFTSVLKIDTIVPIWGKCVIDYEINTHFQIHQKLILLIHSRILLWVCIFNAILLTLVAFSIQSLKKICCKFNISEVKFNIIWYVQWFETYSNDFLICAFKSVRNAN